ncbi:MAG: hypothetical protein K9J17_08645 [Flavobacteriales bacterium]|nr:hypothetical protein [Flavobacteriales bacterium]
MLSAIWSSTAFRSFSRIASFLIVLYTLTAHSTAFGQATLPVSRTTWTGAEPTGWTENGTVDRTSSFACSGSNGSTFNSTGDKTTINFSSAPDELVFKLKKASMSGASSMLVERSDNGSVWTTIGTFGTASGATAISDCADISISLTSATRYVRWTYTKATGNCDFDDVSISAATVAPTIVLSSPSQTGVANIAQSSTDNILSHFQAEVTVADATLNSLAFTTTGTYGASDLTGTFKLYYGTSSVFGSASSIATVAVGAAGTYTFSSLSQAISSGNTGYFWIVADASGTSGGNRTLTISANPTLSFASGSVSGTIDVGGTKTFVIPSSPTLSTTSITAFGTQCIGGTYGPNSFDISGTNLTSADITVAALSGYTFSTTTGGTYTPTLTLTQAGGTYSQTVYVKFSPVAASVYNGNITVGGGGASDVDAAASGTGTYGTPAVTTVTATGVTIISASSGGNTISTSCGTITDKGVVWGASANPTIISNLGITSDGTGTGSYTSSITGLSAATSYHYRAYVTNSNGITSYGADLTFVTPTPTLSAGSLTAFGAQCPNVTYGPNSFTITGTNLSAANVTVASLTGYTFSTTSGGTYTPSLSLTQAGGAYSQAIYVKFTPTAATTYNGNIVVGGGGASNINVAASGSGQTTVPTGLSISCNNGTATATWSNPACYDELMLVVSAASFTAAMPSGDGSAYTANSAFGSGTVFDAGRVVYKSTGAASGTITGLTNGTAYNFKLFARKGSSWSVAATVETCTPENICETEDMDGGNVGSGSYWNSSYSKYSGAVVYSWTNAIKETSTAYTHNSSTFAIRLRDVAGSSFTAKLTDGGMGIFSAYVRRWNSTPDPNYTVEYSTNNGGAWTAVTTINNAWLGNSDAYKELTFSVNAYSAPANSADDILVRFTNVSGERLIIDDVMWSCYAANPVVSLGISPSSGTETAETTVRLTATADAAVSGDQSVNVIITAGGTDTDFYNGADFSGTVSITILDGQTSGYIEFDIKDDSDIEGDETVTFSLTGPSAGVNLDVPANISVDLDITDNDNITSYESAVVEQGGEIATISSLTTGSIANVSSGVQVWKFRLYDGDGSGSDVDDLPTIYSGWTIRASAGNEVPDWDLAIGDLAFFNGSTELSAGGVLISGSSITFSFPSPVNYISVTDNGYVEIDMRLTLQSSLPLGSDGQHFGFSIDDADVYVDSDLLASSQLGTFTETSDATKNEISVVGTLQFINAPAGVTLGTNFSATVSVVDANGNIDADVTNSITLSLTSGSGTLTGVPVTASLVGGTYTFSGLNHDTEETIEITAHDNGSVYADLSVSIIVSIEPHQLFDDFNRANNAVVGVPSSETVTAYSEVGTGNGTRTRIEDNQLLLTNCDNGSATGGTNGMERVMFNVESRYETIYDNTATDMEWVFNINQSRPSPSGLGTGTNNTYAAAVILGSSHEDVYDPSALGYAVIIGHPGATPDYVKLIRFAGGLGLDANTTDVALSTESNADNHFSVKVIYSSCSGEWSISVRDDGGSFADPNVGSLGTPVTAIDQTHVLEDLKYFGYVWKHGTSCTETATFDNVSIPNSVSGTPTSSNKIWNGSANSDWHVGENWGPCTGIPTLSDNVTIPNTTNKPHIYTGLLGLCNTISVQTDLGAKLYIDGTGKLKVHLP